MTYPGLDRALPPLLADVSHARQLLALGFPAEAGRILADRSGDPVADRARGLIAAGEKGAAILCLDALAASYELA